MSGLRTKGGGEMGALSGEELARWEKMQAATAREEKILVLVRLRPLSEKEIARNEVSDWECINENTVLFRNSLQERSMFPTAYSFGEETLTFLPSSCQILLWV